MSICVSACVGVSARVCARGGAVTGVEGNRLIASAAGFVFPSRWSVREAVSVKGCEDDVLSLGCLRCSLLQKYLTLQSESVQGKQVFPFRFSGF